ncbi:hypothetical protein FKM82_029147 [Ascaphus truei]
MPRLAPQSEKTRATWSDRGPPSGMVTCIPVPGSKSSGHTISGRTRVTVAPESSKPSACRSPMVTFHRCFCRTLLGCIPTGAN